MENSVESLHSDWQYDTWEEEKLKVMIKKAKERHITKKSQIVNQTRYRAFTQSSNVITCRSGPKKQLLVPVDSVVVQKKRLERAKSYETPPRNLPVVLVPEIKPKKKGSFRSIGRFLKRKLL
jgi:hypothetical protein